VPLVLLKENIMITQGKWKKGFEGGCPVICTEDRIVMELYGKHLGVRVSAEDAALIAAAPDLLEACKVASDMMRLARRYFPKSIQNSDKFMLENVCASGE
jgi:hypothetical protein